MHLFYLNKIPAIEVIYQKAGNLIGPKTKLFQTFSKFLFPAGFGIFSYVEDKSQLRKKEKKPTRLFVKKQIFVLMHHL